MTPDGEDVLETEGIHSSALTEAESERRVLSWIADELGILPDKWAQETVHVVVGPGRGYDTGDKPQCEHCYNVIESAEPIQSKRDGNWNDPESLEGGGVPGQPEPTLEGRITHLEDRDKKHEEVIRGTASLLAEGMDGHRERIESLESRVHTVHAMAAVHERKIDALELFEDGMTARVEVLEKHPLAFRAYPPDRDSTRLMCPWCTRALYNFDDGRRLCHSCDEVWDTPEAVRDEYAKINDKRYQEYQEKRKDTNTTEDIS